MNKLLSRSIVVFAGAAALIRLGYLIFDGNHNFGHGFVAPLYPICWFFGLPWWEHELERNQFGSIDSTTFGGWLCGLVPCIVVYLFLVFLFGYVITYLWKGSGCETK